MIFCKKFFCVMSASQRWREA